MKYLLESADFEKEQTLKEICYDLTDEGFVIEVLPEICSLSILSIGKYKITPYHNIPINFKFSNNLKETILRIVDYLGNDFGKIKIKSNGFEKYYPRYKDTKSLHDFLSAQIGETKEINIYYK